MAIHPMLRTRAAAIAVCTVALTLAFATGAVAAGKITSADIKNHTIQAKDIKKGAVGSSQIKNGAVGTDKIKSNGVHGDDINDGAIGSSDIKSGGVASSNIKDGTVGSKDLANGSVTANKLAPGAVAFPQTLWGPVIRNQQGAAQSTLVTGPTGQPKGDGSLALSTESDSDIAAFGDSIDFAGIQLDDITNLSYWTFTSSAAATAMPRLNIEINPHLVADTVPGGVFEFTTLVHQPVGATGWVEHTNILADSDWYLTGQEGIDIGCTQDTKCTFTAILADLNASGDADTALPAISSGIYFGLGSGAATATSNVDEFVFNNFTFDFEPDGVFLTTS